jgi:AbrB family looped-hinge helix DNA binding protein
MASAHLEVRARVNQSGRVVIPIQFRDALGIKPGDELIFTTDGETFRIETQKHRALRAQEYIRSIIPAGVSLADELIAERREEFRKEMAE